MISNDKAIDSPKQDLLGREFFVSSLIKIVSSYKGEESLTIGIRGARGEGKTSVLNLFKNSYKDEKDQTIILDFNPRNYSSKSDLMRMFFDALTTKLRSLSSKEKIKNTIDTLIDNILIYVDIASGVLQGINIPFPGGSINLGVSLEKIVEKSEKYKKEPTLSEIKEEINHLISSLGYKIIVIIDDIDRLNYTDIIEMFSLVKNIAALNKIIYILPYDENVVSKAFEDHKYGGKEYLEKLIQIPLNLPKLHPTVYSDIFRKNIDALINSLSITYEQEDTSQCYLTIEHNIICGKFKNIRQINRFMNKFRDQLITLKDEIYFMDLIFINLIDFLYPDLFQKLLENKNFLLQNREYLYKSFANKGDYSYEYIAKELGIVKNIDLINGIIYFFPSVTISDEKRRQRANLGHGLMQRRIFSQDFFDLYFNFNVASSPLSYTKEKLILDDINNNPESAKKAISQLKENEVSFFIRDLKSQIGINANFNYKNVVSILVSLGDLIQFSVPQLASSPTTHILSIIDFSLQNIPQKDRLSILAGAIQNCGESVHFSILLMYHLGRPFDRYVVSERKPEPLITSKELTHLETVVLKLIKQEIKSETLINSSNLSTILNYRKYVTSDKNEITEYIKSKTKTLSEKVQFLEKYVNFGWIGNDEHIFEGKYLEDIINLDYFNKAFIESKSKRYQNDSTVKCFQSYISQHKE